MCIHKKCCSVCLDKNVNSFLSYNMPAFMGVVDEYCESKIELMIFEQCQNCKNIQIKNNIKDDILYQNNHNIGLVGSIWKEHYIEFGKFVSKVVKDKNVIEISDPSCKIASLSSDFKSWSIIEPNPNECEECKNVKFIKTFLTSNYKTNVRYDILIHSHFMEHVADLHSFMDQCNKLLADDGYMCFSIPNFDYLVSSNKCPNNILHFEHTIFLNEKIIIYFLNFYGYTLIEFKKYLNHSLFFKFKKTNNKKNTLFELVDLKNIFIKNHEFHLNKIYEINNKLNEFQEVYIFGAHVNSQFYVYNGLNKLSGVLDNSPYKKNKFLYGTNYKVYSPDILINKKNVGVICSHIGTYYKEVIDGLTTKNKNLVIL